MGGEESDDGGVNWGMNRHGHRLTDLSEPMALSRMPTSSANHKSRLNSRFNQVEPEPLKSVIMTSTSSQASPRGFDCCPLPQRVAVRFVDRLLKYVYDAHRSLVPQLTRAKRAISQSGFIPQATNGHALTSTQRSSKVDEICEGPLVETWV